MEIARRYLVGGIALENQRDERLTILNCNRQPLETTLGVDLIYYAHSYDSFVMVQYKRMSGQSGGKAAYRPSADKNYEPELSRMSTIEEELMANSEVPIGKHAEFRLSSRPFFVKLCESKAKAALDEGMVSGMYIPLQLWQGFLTSADAKGKRGGISIGWDNAPRHFNNSEFTWLLRQGWIGSSGRQSTLLSEIVAAVLESDHMLVFAATSLLKQAGTICEIRLVVSPKRQTHWHHVSFVQHRAGFGAFAAIDSTSCWLVQIGSVK